MSPTTPPRARFLLHVDDLPPGPNATRGQHWAARRRANERTSLAVLGAWLKGGRPRAEGRPALVSVEIEAFGQPDDPDNRLARLKPLFDALVTLGALVDDSSEWVSHEHPTRRKGRARRPVCHVTIVYGEKVAKVDADKGGAASPPTKNAAPPPSGR